MDQTLLPPKNVGKARKEGEAEPRPCWLGQASLRVWCAAILLTPELSRSAQRSGPKSDVGGQAPAKPTCPSKSSVSWLDALLTFPEKKTDGDCIVARWRLNSLIALHSGTEIILSLDGEQNADRIFVSCSRNPESCPRRSNPAPWPRGSPAGL